MSPDSNKKKRPEDLAMPVHAADATDWKEYGRGFEGRAEQGKRSVIKILWHLRPSCNLYEFDPCGQQGGRYLKYFPFDEKIFL